MRHLFIATVTTAVLLASGAFPDRAGAADVPPAYGPPSVYGPAPGYRPPPGYSPSDDYSRPPAYGPPSAYGPPPGYSPSDEYGPPPAYNPPSGYPPPSAYRYDRSDDYGPPTDYGPPPRPPHAIPYAVSRRSYAVRPAACDRQWRCGPWGCRWRRVCYPAQPSAEHYARPYRGFADRGYGPLPGPGHYGPY
jgi:hypothetical protein